ncbi:MAG: hypothetical protein K1X36_09560 [Pyrinomonadaceae bacterium]|nr:hypothetical protein [Pyrinomonadaceae bacterium]
MRSIAVLAAILMFALSLQAQTTRVKLGTDVILVQGTVFNSIDYDLSTGKARYLAYRYMNKSKRSLIITEVRYEFERGRPVASSVETFTCPLDKISKDKSYNLEMEDEAVRGGRYWRLTLLAAGTGADNLFFKKQSLSAGDKPTSASVGFVTINITDRAAAEKLLADFTR